MACARACVSTLIALALKFSAVAANADNTPPLAALQSVVIVGTTARCGEGSPSDQVPANALTLAWSAATAPRATGT